MQNKLFEFMNDAVYKLMLDMVKDTHTQTEEKDIKLRFQNTDLATLYSVCREHELDGVAGSYAMSLGLVLGAEWENGYEQQKRHLTFLRDTALDICRIMDANGIPMVVLKNGGIMIGMMDDVVKCPMGDIDSLVRKSDFYKAHGILEDNGFTFKFRNEFEAEKLDLAYRDGSTEYYIKTPDGEKVWFELAWRAVAGRWIRPDLEPDTDGFIARSYMPEGTRVHVLAPEDNLLQVCVHTAKHSYVRAPGLRLHMDVDRIVAHTSIDWEMFIKTAAAAHVKTAAYLSLYIPSVCFGTPVPQEVLRQLRPKNAEKLLRILAKAGLTHPQERKFGKLSYLRFQTALYDRRMDIFKVIYPGTEWMRARYECKSNTQLLRAAIYRMLNLIGFGKKL